MKIAALLFLLLSLPYTVALSLSTPILVLLSSRGRAKEKSR